ncbi:MAG: fatty acid desaturase [Bacteroidota bacterium]|nr:fatty acid desaturase [Bacteroidota bacterium]MDP4215858.1 fatty acid desaturase [Bacteroidota bacterium]MDP4246570.1 fatty acid desaturase [Bacteroidota bacterium]MDP4254004.1 fatty acid desaturase [Bacteroidota bacterium]MDP4258407.1 fatty acid desaturase [Bacteroidota bacterium]
MLRKTDFVHSEKQEPHRIRTRQILQRHPDVRKLIGKNANTIFAILGLVILQVVLAWFVSDRSWWLVVGLAYFVGAFADHALFVMIHECAHHLLFKSRSANRLAGILANLPQLFPSSVSFERYHIKHHSFQGIHELDADLPNRWEARLINNYFFGKVIWLLFYPLFQVFRISRLKEIKPFDKWVALNFGMEAAFIAAIWILLGPKAIVFLLLSFFFSVGLHPLGARWVQEHYLTHGEQETYSYYGVLNKVAFNVGYHNEHHDFPSIPWNKLPQIKKSAPDFYDNLASHRSWTKLFFRFLFDREISLFSRVVRKERGKVALTDESKPDLEVVSVK